MLEYVFEEQLSHAYIYHIPVRCAAHSPLADPTYSRYWRLYQCGAKRILYNQCQVVDNAPSRCYSVLQCDCGTTSQKGGGAR